MPQKVAFIAGQDGSYLAELLLEKDVDTATGKVTVSVDPLYFRLTKEERVFGASEKAKAKPDWIPRITVEEMNMEMVGNDIEEARIEKMLQERN